MPNKSPGESEDFTAAFLLGEYGEEVVLSIA
jgi:hypothetical protein